jgi:hypothetical protein
VKEACRIGWVWNLRLACNGWGVVRLYIYVNAAVAYSLMLIGLECGWGSSPVVDSTGFFFSTAIFHHFYISIPS